MDKTWLIKQIDAFYADASRSQGATRAALEEISEHCTSLAQSLEKDDGYDED